MVQRTCPRALGKGPLSLKKHMSKGKLCHKEQFHYGGVYWNGKSWMIYFKCKKCSTADVAVPPGNCTNLLNHEKVAKCMGATGLRSIVQALKSNNPQTSMDHFFSSQFSEHEKGIYGWIEVIVEKYIPLSIVEDSFRRMRMNCGSTSVSIKTIRQTSGCFAAIVENKVADSLPTKIAIMLDGWARFSSYYL